MCGIDSYSLQCRKCRHVGKHTREYLDGNRVHLGFVCTHPARMQGVYVNLDDCPYNPCASENARKCPLKWSDER